MTQALHYLPAGETPPKSRLRQVYSVIYYVSWSVALMVPATVAVASEFSNGPDGHRTFIVGPAVGAPLGLALAFLLGRRLWAQVAAIVIGAPMAVFGGLLTYRIWTEPRVFMWEVGAFLFTAILVEGVALGIAGASGLALVRRAGRYTDAGSAR